MARGLGVCGTKDFWSEAEKALAIQNGHIFWPFYDALLNFLLDRFSDLLLVKIEMSTVYMSVANVDSFADRTRHLTGIGLKYKKCLKACFIINKTECSRL